MSTRSFVSARVVHCLTVELRTMLRRVFAPRREISLIPFAVIEMMIDVPIEVLRAVKPWSRADEYTA